MRRGLVQRILTGRLGVRLTGGGGLLPFSDDFARDDGALGTPWLGDATWQIASGKAVNTPTLGAELITNGDMELDSDWSSTTAPPPATNERSSEQARGGTYSRKAIGDGNGSGFVQNFNVVAGGWYFYDTWIYVAVGTTTLQSNAGVVLAGSLNTSAAAWSNVVLSGRAISSAAAGIKFNQAGITAATFYADDVSVKRITLADLFNAVDAGSANVDASVAATVVRLTQAGVVVCLDSLTTPANFIIGYHDGTTAKLEKCVGGTYTTLVSVTTAYSAGAAVRVVKNGTTVQLFYNGTQVGTDQTVSDAGIISNTYHGLFSTYAGNTLDTFSVSAV